MSDKRNKQLCSAKYGQYNQRKCTREAKYIYTGPGLDNGKAFCGLHAERFLPEGLVSIELYQALQGAREDER